MPRPHRPTRPFRYFNSSPEVRLVVLMYVRAGIAAQDADDRMIYDHSTGQILYDAHGSGSTAAVLFAVLENHAAIVATDFVIA